VPCSEGEIVDRWEILKATGEIEREAKEQGYLVRANASKHYPPNIGFKEKGLARYAIENRRTPTSARWANQYARISSYWADIIGRGAWAPKHEHQQAVCRNSTLDIERPVHRIRHGFLQWDSFSSTDDRGVPDRHTLTVGVYCKTVGVYVLELARSVPTTRSLFFPKGCGRGTSRISIRRYIRTIYKLETTVGYSEPWAQGTECSEIHTCCSICMSRCCFSTMNRSTVRRYNPTSAGLTDDFSEIAVMRRIQ